MYRIFTYIGVVLGVNVGIYGSPMECLGILPTTATTRRASPVRSPPGKPGLVSERVGTSDSAPDRLGGDRQDGSDGCDLEGRRKRIHKVYPW